MEIKRMKIADIGEAEYNPRKRLRPGHPEYEAIKKSIEEFGLVEPLIFNQRTGNLVGGHQRLGVLKAAGITEVDVSIVDIDQEKEKALNIAMNKVEGAWDQGALENLIQELTETGQEIIGFDQQEIDDILLKMEMEQAEMDRQREANGADLPEDLMGTGIERPDQGEERVTITMRATPEVFTDEAIAGIKGQWSHRGVEIKTERGPAK